MSTITLDYLSPTQWGARHGMSKQRVLWYIHRQRLPVEWVAGRWLIHPDARVIPVDRPEGGRPRKGHVGST